MLERLATGISAVLAAALTDHLPRQRWFGGKGRALEAVELFDLAPLGAVTGAADESSFFLAIVRVRDADGSTEDYTLPLRLVAETGAEGAFGTVRGTAPGRAVFDASIDGETARALLAGFARRERIRTWRNAELCYEDVPDREAARVAALVRESPRPLGAEQSNTSLRVGDGAIFKLFRRLEQGENPEVEVGRFLTSRTGFRATPLLLGSLTHRTDIGPPRSVGVLQSFVQSFGDGWSWMLDRLRERNAGRIGDDALFTEARMLGDVTAEMHLALASDRAFEGFGSRPISGRDASVWRDSFLARARRVLEELEAAAADDAAWLRAHADRLLGVGERIVAGAEAGFDLIRVHGDYHLGQTLRTQDGYVVMDFEGEPVRPLAERRAPNAALKDVAGMLRSFDYAEATVTAETDAVRTMATATAGSRREESGDRPPALHPLRRVFLSAYATRAEGGFASFLPGDPAVLARWTDFFEIDKALYEIEYELRNRPDWLWIPLRGVRRRLEETGQP